ncbi:MAG: T9SS type A sorting domain-containing protein [bacterium]
MKKIIFFCFILWATQIWSQNVIVFDKNNSLLSSNKIISVAQDNNNTYWIVTGAEFINGVMISDGYLQKFSSGSWSIFDSSSSPLTKNIVQDVAVSNDNKVVIATIKGVYIFDHNNWLNFNKDNSPLPDNFIYTVTIDKLNRYWFGIPNFGICVYDNGNWSYFNYQNSFNGIEDFNFIKADNLNNIWVGTDYYGLYVYNGTDWQKKIDNKLNDKLCYIFGLTVDSLNTKWVTVQTNDNKHYMASGQDTPFAFFEFSNINYPFTFFSYESVVLDKNNNLFLGTTDGMLKYDGNIWTIIDSINLSLSGNYFTGGFVDNNNNKIFCLATYTSNSYKGLLFYNETGVLLSAKEEGNNTVFSSYNLNQNYPNPFNPSTTIEYFIPTSNMVSLKVYDVLGKEVANLVDEYINAGKHKIIFNAADFSTGTYFYRILSGTYNETKKLLLLK